MSLAARAGFDAIVMLNLWILGVHPVTWRRNDKAHTVVESAPMLFEKRLVSEAITNTQNSEPKQGPYRLIILTEHTLDSQAGNRQLRR
jgi:hypothetical protein